MEDLHPPTSARQRTVPVEANLPIARDTFRLRLNDPELARAIRPGQFLMVRPADGCGGPLLGRPFAVYDVIRSPDGRAAAVDLVYLVLGAGTQALARLRPGDRATIWGPLGNGFGPGPGADRAALFVAGGIGQTPFLALGKWWLGQVPFGTDRPRPARSAAEATLLYGVRSRDLAAGLADFEAAGIAVELATDDGSAGHHGFVTDLLARHLRRPDPPARVVACGPPAMLAAVARLTAERGVECQVSLENHMACGFGVCFSCVAPIRQADGTTDLRRVCVEGPIFDAEAVAWPDPRHVRALE